MKIPFFLVTGFLGSGKTTLLKNMLSAHADSRRIAIVQNEFAPSNIDGTELKQLDKDFEILEINNGSVFCVCLLNDFVKSLGSFIEIHSPDVIILESSGLSDPVAIIQMLQSPELSKKVYLSHIWCVIDAVNFFKINKLVKRVIHQIRIADTVIINKTDMSDQIEDIKNKIIEYNNFAEIVTTSFCEIKLSDMFSPFRIQPVAIRKAPENAMFESCGRPEINSGVLRTTKKITLHNLDLFLNEFTTKSFRLKGFVLIDDGSVVAVQSSYGLTEINTVKSYNGSTELVVMGEEIIIADFNSRFLELT